MRREKGGCEWNPTVVAAPDDGFIVAWNSASGHGGNATYPPTERTLMARRYGADGTPAGPEYVVATYWDVSYLSGASLAVNSQGRLLATWVSRGEDGDHAGIFGCRRPVEASDVCAPFQVNAYTESYQTYPHAAAGPDGRFVVVWTSDGPDGDVTGIFGRVITPSAP